MLQPNNNTECHKKKFTTFNYIGTIINTFYYYSYKNKNNVPYIWTHILSSFLAMITLL